jgi:hypothetical protein
MIATACDEMQMLRSVVALKTHGHKANLALEQAQIMGSLTSVAPTRQLC